MPSTLPSISLSPAALALAVRGASPHRAARPAPLLIGEVQPVLDRVGRGVDVTRHVFADLVDVLGDPRRAPRTAARDPVGPRPPRRGSHSVWRGAGPRRRGGGGGWPPGFREKMRVMVVLGPSMPGGPRGGGAGVLLRAGRAGRAGRSDSPGPGLGLVRGLPPPDPGVVVVLLSPRWGSRAGAARRRRRQSGRRRPDHVLDPVEVRGHSDVHPHAAAQLAEGRDAHDGVQAERLLQHL